MSYPWKSRALCLEAPTPGELDRFCTFIRTRLVEDRIDTLVLLTRYRFSFDSHPECRGEDPISKTDAAQIAAVCRECGIHLIPKMNLLGHQSDGSEDVYPILKFHPELDESEGAPVEYCRSICPTHPASLPLVLDLVDEMTAAFGCDAFHMGMDEVFELGKCPRCRTHSTAELFSGWVNAIAAHLKQKGVTPYMWGDRLLNSDRCGHGPWDASRNGTDPAIETVDHDIVICDWHYHNWPRFPSVETFGEAGFKMYLCTFNVAENAKLFFDYAKAHDVGQILGVMETTWCPAKYFMDGIEGREAPENGKWYKEGLPGIIRCYRWMVENC